MQTLQSTTLQIFLVLYLTHLQEQQVLYVHVSSPPVTVVAMGFPQPDRCPDDMIRISEITSTNNAFTEAAIMGNESWYFLCLSL